MHHFTPSDQARVAEATRRAEAVGVGLPIVPNAVYGAPTIIGDDPGFSGYCRVKGVVTELDLRQAKAFVRVNLLNGQVTWNDGPDPGPNAPNEVWFRTDFSIGDIVIV